MNWPIAFFTDFGSQDIYVGQLHARTRACGSDSHLIDYFHDAIPFDIPSNGSLLAAMLNYLPKEVVLVGVVDPGVGSSRRPIAIQLNSRWLVGPDNGLFSRSIAWSKMEPAYFSIAQSNATSKTFDGRDLFLPVAIELAKGKLDVCVPVEDLRSLTTYNIAATIQTEDSRVVHIDRYGNLITGIRGHSVTESQVFIIHGQRVGHASYYECVPKSECFWYVNSIDLIEIAANQDSAANILSAAIGTGLDSGRQDG